MRLTRRRFTQAVGAATLGLALRPSSGRAELPVMRMAQGTGLVDVQTAFVTVGAHPKLGFYKQEGIEIGMVVTSSPSQAMQALLTGSAEFGVLNPTSYFPLYAKNPSLDAISAYVWLPQNHVAVGVKPDGPIKSLADLKGRKIGIFNVGDTGYFRTQAMLNQLGIDPKTEVEWVSIGGGGPAGIALYGGQVDAIAIWDAELARIELTGHKLRIVPNTPELDALFGSTFGVRRSALKANPERYVGLFRAIAKTTVFTHANPELAARMHWQLWPEGKPKGKSEADALHDALYILDVRKDKWFPGPLQQDKRMGGSTLAEWQAQIRFSVFQNKELPAQIKDAAPLFTNELIDEVNRFDRAEIERMAKTITL